MPGTGLKSLHRSTHSSNNPPVIGRRHSDIKSPPQDHEKCGVGPDVAPEGLALNHSAALPTLGLAHNALKLSQAWERSPASCLRGCAARSSWAAKDDRAPSRMLRPEPSTRQECGVSETCVARGSFLQRRGPSSLRSRLLPDWVFDGALLFCDKRGQQEAAAVIRDLHLAK